MRRRVLVGALIVAVVGLAAGLAVTFAASNTRPKRLLQSRDLLEAFSREGVQLHAAPKFAPLRAWEASSKNGIVWAMVAKKKIEGQGPALRFTRADARMSYLFSFPRAEFVVRNVFVFTLSSATEEKRVKSAVATLRRDAGV